MKQRLRLENNHKSQSRLWQSQGWNSIILFVTLYVLLQTNSLINLGISLINSFPVCWSEGRIFMWGDKVLLGSSDSLELPIFLPRLECWESIQVLTRVSRRCFHWDTWKFSSRRNRSRNFSEASNHWTNYSYKMISLLKQLMAALVLACSIDLIILTFVVSMLHKGSLTTIILIVEEVETQIKCF